MASHDSERELCETETISEMAGRVNELLPELTVKLIHFVKDFSSSDMTVAQAFLLWNLQEHGPCTASAIGDFMGITSGPVTSLTKRLMTKGLVKREQDMVDGRVFWFSLTDEGLELALRLAKVQQGKWAQVLTQLGLERSHAAIRLMEDVMKILNRIEEERGDSSDKAVE